MSRASERSAEWVYRGIWAVLAHLFRVPKAAPRLSKEMSDNLQVFHPSRQYLKYMKAYFWVALVVIDVAIFVVWLIIYWASPTTGILLSLPALVIAVLPDIIAYIAIHLRFDTIWYAISDRGLYVRRGIWIITEHTITLENIQNVSVRRGPIEQLFGISTVVIETAGSSASGEEEGVFAVGNQTIMVGLDNAAEISEMLLKHVRQSASAGLGDELHGTAPAWSREDIHILESIRDEVKQLA